MSHMHPLKCNCCGSLRMEKGALRSTGEVSFTLDDAKFLTLNMNSVETDAYVCVDCGYTALYTDVKKLGKLKDDD